jgi:hypothetical protein
MWYPKFRLFFVEIAFLFGIKDDSYSRFLKMQKNRSSDAAEAVLERDACGKDRAHASRQAAHGK